MSKKNGKQQNRIVKFSKSDSLKLIHAETKVQTVIMLVDNEGNVINKRILEVNIAKLDRSSFCLAADQLIEAKNKIESDILAGKPEAVEK